MDWICARNADSSTGVAFITAKPSTRDAGITTAESELRRPRLLFVCAKLYPNKNEINNTLAPTSLPTSRRELEATLRPIRDSDNRWEIEIP